MTKQGGKIACGHCHQFFNEDELILDEKNNRYLCDGCYEPRDQEPPEVEEEHCKRCGELVDNCDCEDNGDEIEERTARTTRGEARINHKQMSGRVCHGSERERPPKNKKSVKN